MSMLWDDVSECASYSKPSVSLRPRIHSEAMNIYIYISRNAWHNNIHHTTLMNWPLQDLAKTSEGKHGKQKR